MPTPSSAERHLDPARMITIVSGLPRSGTSMMMQMLEAAGLEIASDALRAADADNPRGYYELEAVKRIRDDDSFLGECIGRVVKIVAPLLLSLPEEYDYRIVFMERDLAEVLASQREMLKRRGEEGGGADDAVMERAYRGQVDRVKEWLAGRNNVRVLFASHRSTLDEPRSMAAHVLAFFAGGGGPSGPAKGRPQPDPRVEEMARVVDAKLRRHFDNE
jgi:hypothetical protein